MDTLKGAYIPGSFMQVNLTNQYWPFPIILRWVSIGMNNHLPSLHKDNVPKIMNFRNNKIKLLLPGRRYQIINYISESKKLH